MKRIDFKTIGKRLAELPAMFPVEVFVIVLFFSGFEALDLMDLPFKARSEWWTTLAMLPLCFFGAFVLNRWTRARGKGRWAYYAMAAVAVAVLVPDVNDLIKQTKWQMAYPLAICALLLCGGGRENQTVANNAYRQLACYVQGGLCGACCCLASLIISQSYSLLFGPSSFLEYLLINISLSLVMPLAWLYFFAKSSDSHVQPNRLANVVFNVIVPVSLLCYTIMLYVYFAKVVMSWTLPDGGVAWMVIAFMAASLSVAFYQEISPSRLCSIAARWVGFVALPLLAMFWVGLLYRTGQYGITSSRYYLLAAGVVMTLIVLLLCVPRWRSYRVMLMLGAAAVVLTSFVPGITADAVSFRSQGNRLQTLAQQYDLLDSEGHFKEEKSLKAVPEAVKASIESAYEYLEVADRTATHARFGILPGLPEMKKVDETKRYERPDMEANFGMLLGGPFCVYWTDSEMTLVHPDGHSSKYDMSSYQSRIEKLWRSRAQQLPADAFVFHTPDGYTLVFDRVEVFNDDGEIFVEGRNPVIVFKKPADQPAK